MTLNVRLPLMGFMLWSCFSSAQAAAPFDQPGNTSGWRSFTSRAGWTIKYPQNYQISSCNSCSDPTAPHVPVYFSDPTAGAIVIDVDQFIDKPPNYEAKEWLSKLKHDVVLRPIVSEEWTSIDRVPALKVTYTSDYVRTYVVNDSKTFAIDSPSDFRGNPSLERVYQQMLSTFRFVKRVR